jgi:hypothetical protein
MSQKMKHLDSEIKNLKYELYLKEVEDLNKIKSQLAQNRATLTDE